MQDDSRLQQSSARVVRVIALELLDLALTAAGRLGGHARPDDAEALHDFRVATRRLRSWLRAWQPRLSDSVTARSRRRLRRIARATGPARDAEVHLEWLRSERTKLRGRQRTGADWLIATLEDEQRAARADVVASARALESAHAKLSKQLHRYTLRLHPDRDADDDPFGEALGELAREYAADLRRRLGAVHDAGDDAKAHRARIAAKRLRYVLEPFAGARDHGAEIVERLTALQQLLGDLHDTHVFSGEVTAASAAAAAEQAMAVSEAVVEDAPATELQRERAGDPGPGLLAIARMLHRRGITAFEAVRRDWLGDEAETFFARLEAFATSLAST